MRRIGLTRMRDSAGRVRPRRMRPMLRGPIGERRARQRAGARAGQGARAQRPAQVRARQDRELQLRAVGAADDDRVDAPARWAGTWPASRRA